VQNPFGANSKDCYPAADAGSTFPSVLCLLRLRKKQESTLDIILMFLKFGVIQFVIAPFPVNLS
jgi:hypothetical protein